MRTKSTFEKGGAKSTFLKSGAKMYTRWVPHRAAARSNGRGIAPVLVQIRGGGLRGHRPREFETDYLFISIYKQQNGHRTK